MKKKYLLVVLIIIFCFFLTYFFMIKYSNYKLCKLGDSVALKIEDFKKVQHRLPNSLKEIGIEEDPIFYILIDSNAYQLSFPLSALGESAIYDSKEKTWYIPD